MPAWPIIRLVANVVLFGRAADARSEMMGRFCWPGSPWLPQLVTPGVVVDVAAARDGQIVLRDLEFVQEAVLEDVDFVQSSAGATFTPWLPV